MIFINKTNFKVCLTWKSGEFFGNYEVDNLDELSEYLNDGLIVKSVIFKSKIAGNILCWDLEILDDSTLLNEIDYIKTCILMRLGEMWVNSGF